jgi:potassium-transporting ATPase KdpC subunit
VIAPFVGIKLIDLALVAPRLVRVGDNPNEHNGKTMIRHLRANCLLLLFTLVICSVLYPLAVWVVGELLFSSKARGSLLDKNGEPAASEKGAVGSRLIAQQFAGEEYFQPRPSAASYNGAASAASNWGPNNHLLRDRIARQLGRIVKYHSGVKKGRSVSTDIEEWFQKDRFQNKPGIVAQWAQAHATLATNWVKTDPLNAEYVAAWRKDHSVEVGAWINGNQGTPDPKPADLAVPFFISYSLAHPGTFPGVVTQKTTDAGTEKRVEPIKRGSDIQGIFFELWLQEHAEADLEPVPADMVMASGSGLDPHITLKNAHYQLDRVATKCAEKANRNQGSVRAEIESLLREKTEAPLGRLGAELINVLEVNLVLQNRYGA